MLLTLQLVGGMSILIAGNALRCEFYVSFVGGVCWRDNVCSGQLCWIDGTACVVFVFGCLF